MDVPPTIVTSSSGERDPTPAAGAQGPLLLGGLGGVGALVGVVTGHPIALLLVPVAIILCGAATGIGQGLQVGLRDLVLRRFRP